MGENHSINPRGKQPDRQAKFHSYPGATFSEADVENYLEELSEKGWRVFKDRNEYIVVINEEGKITTYFSQRYKEWRFDISSLEGKMQPSLEPAVSFRQFKECFAKAAEYFGQHLENGPQNIRLRENTPVSNKSSITSLARGNTVKCVFDPYFDDATIATLATFVNLGMSLENTVRILTTSKVKTRLSLQQINDFKAEKGINLDIRFCQSDKEHRRYLLLFTGESIVIGCSLNSLNKNEAAHIEDSQEDREFFEEQWKMSSLWNMEQSGTPRINTRK